MLPIIYTLVARVGSHPHRLGDYSTKAGDFRDIAWELLCRIAKKWKGRKKEIRVVKRYQVAIYTFHLCQFENNLAVLCLTPSSAMRSKVSHYLQIVHSQVIVLFASQNRRKLRSMGPGTEKNESNWLYDQVSRVSFLLQHLMQWAANSGEISGQLFPGIRTNALSAELVTSRGSESPFSDVKSNSHSSSGNSSRSRINENHEKQHHCRSRTNGDTGILLPVGFGNANETPHQGATHPLDHLIQAERKSLLESVSLCKTVFDYLSLLNKHRHILLSLSLPNSKPTSREQAFKDAVREKISLNGKAFSGNDVLRLTRELERLIAPFAHNAAARVETAMDVLRAASRTCTGGDSFFGISSIFSRPGVVVTAGHMAARPVEISINSTGEATIVSHNSFEIHNEEELMGGDDGNGIITIDTVIQEVIDCISGNAERIMSVKCPIIENMPLIVRVLKCGNPSVNGVYRRYDSNGWGPKDIYYANDNGIFLSQRHIAEEKLIGERVRVAEREWVLANRSKGIDYFVASILDQGREEEHLILEPPSDGWRPVKGIGALPCPQIVVKSRGYAAVELDGRNRVAVEGKSDRNCEAKETGFCQSADGEDVLTGDIFQQVTQNNEANIASNAVCRSPGVDLIVASEQEKVVLGGVGEVQDKKLRSSIVKGFSPGQERMCVSSPQHGSKHQSSSAVARAAAASHKRRLSRKSERQHALEN